MEVVHRGVEVEEEEQLRLRRRPDLADPSGYVSSDDSSSSGGMKEDKKVHENSISPKSVYLDNNEDTKIQWSVSGVSLRAEEESDISKLVNAVMINRQSIIGDFKNEILSVSSVKIEGDGDDKIGANEIINAGVDEEMGSDEEEIELEFERAVDKVHTHTPFCPKCRNQITKVILRRKIPRPAPRHAPSTLFGCLSCFTIFIPSGDCLNPFGFFGSKPKVESPNANPSTSYKHREEEEAVAAKPEDPTDHITIEVPDARRLGSSIIREPYVDVAEQEQQPLISRVQRSKPLEILKCIVHGGLLESIASLSVVSSASAADATTLNVVTIGLATLFSGLIAFGYNLVDLRNEEEKYEQLLGRKGHFAFHSTFAIFSYLVFGLVAPTTYGFAFRDSDNRDYKMIAVAAAGIACVLILAVANAYVRGADKLRCYVKTVVYYVTMAVSVSGIAYGSGDLVGMLADKFGWFDSSTSAPASAWASY